jgi:hypothetical protein
MRRTTMLVACLATAGMIAYGADERRAAAQQSPGYMPRLGDIMGTVQLRHFKLWFAGDLKNWALAQYELQQIRDSFSDAEILYQNVPVGDIEVTMIERPLADLADAITAKNRARFTHGFADLTATCNHCHQAAKVGFIMVRIPTTSPFSNQSFSPTGK